MKKNVFHESILFLVISHIYRMGKYFYRKCKGKNPKFESGLKLFLSKYDLERLYDFEEECIDGMLREKEAELLRKTDNRVKNVHDMMEEVKLKMEDLERWETLTNESSQQIDCRLQRLEQISQQTANQLVSTVTLCSRNFQNVKLRLDFVEICSFYRHSDFA